MTVDRLLSGVARRLTIVVVLAGGAFFLGSGLYIKAKAWLAHFLIASAWERSERSKPWPWADTHPVAKLSVRRLAVERYVLAGDNGRTLAFGPGHRSATPLPGEAGNSVIAGHRDTHFNFVRELAAGDVVLVDTRDGSRVEYRVSETMIVNKSDVSVIDATDDRVLTLITCYPFDALSSGGPLRWIVRATAVPASERGRK